MTISKHLANYFENLEVLLKSYPSVVSYQLQSQPRTLFDGYIRGEVVFTDGSRLHFRELVTVKPIVQRISYAYQYMRDDNSLLFRYDNADHFPNLENAPNHKHIGENEVIAITNLPDLAMVLGEIHANL
ncbi:MAG: hypothetical protein OHK0052_12340 [Anaerolineales bacterium]